MAEVGSPTLENLPKVDADLKSELEQFKPELMKKASTQEKIVLPSAEGIIVNIIYKYIKYITGIFTFSFALQACFLFSFYFFLQKFNYFSMVSMHYKLCLINCYVVL